MQKVVPLRNDLTYQVQQLYKALSNAELAELGLVTAPFIKETLLTHQKELQASGATTASHDATIAKLEHALDELTGYYQSKHNNHKAKVTKAEAMQYYSAIRDEVTALKRQFGE